MSRFGFIARDFLAAKLVYKILSYALLRSISKRT